jgi:hypothetical protein
VADSVQINAAGHLGLCARLGYAFNRSWRLKLGGRVHYVFPEIAVYFADVSVATFGQPVVDTVLSLDFMPF